MPEAWLSGPIAGVEEVLMPAAFGLMQARADLESAPRDLSADELSAAPGGAASAGYHLRHIAGSIDRLLTYRQGQMLNDAQKQAATAESRPTDGADPEALFAAAFAAIDRALAELRAVDPVTLHDARRVGRAQLPSTVFGVLCHVSEHTYRHVGQFVTTVKIVRGLGLT